MPNPTLTVGAHRYYEKGELQCQRSPLFLQARNQTRRITLEGNSTFREPNQRKMVVVVNAFVLFASAKWPRRQRRYPQLPRLKVSSAVISMIAVHPSAEKRSAIAPNEPGLILGRESLLERISCFA